MDKQTKEFTQIYNQQVRRKRKRSQREPVGKALQMVVLALDSVRDCQVCGSPVVAGWLDPAVLRLVKAKQYLSDALREGDEL